MSRIHVQYLVVATNNGWVIMIFSNRLELELVVDANGINALKNSLEKVRSNPLGFFMD